MLVVLSILFLVAFIPRFFAARKIDMTWDEGVYAFCGISALKNTANRNFSSDAWNFEFHPPVVMFLFGAAYAVYVFFVSTFKRGLSVNLNLLYQDGMRLFSGQRGLLVLRLPSITFGSLTCVFTYFIALDIFHNEAIAVLASIFLALNPLFIAWSSVAMLESGVTFFYSLTIWAILRAIEYNSIAYAAISGVFLGLAFGSKETGFGVPLVVLPWFVFSLFKMYGLNGLDTWIRMGQYALIWLLAGLLTFYLTWPWLWKNPIKQFVRNMRAVQSRLTSWGGTHFAFYIVNLLATTPVSLLFLYGVGVIDGVFMMNKQINSFLLLSWALFPLILVSTPLVPKRGGAYEIVFILPALSILAGVATYEISKTVATFFGAFFIPNITSNSNFFNQALILLSFIFIGLMILECAHVHPYYMDYYNFVARVLSKPEQLLVGWWGEGMDEAIAYIDQHAPPCTNVWIYGPKSTAFYHSSRVDLAKSTEGEPLFHERAEAGFDVPVHPSLYGWRNGDLKFYFPYYYSYKRNIEQLESEGVSYIVVYRWATYDLAIKTWVDPKNHKLVSKLRDLYRPVFTTKINNKEVCWVYRIDPYLNAHIK